MRILLAVSVHCFRLQNRSDWQAVTQVFKCPQLFQLRALELGTASTGCHLSLGVQFTCASAQ